MKTSRKLMLAMVFAIAFTSCKKEDVSASSDITTQINSLPNEPLSAEEILSLKIMREEEKLAHDVYVTLYNKWKVNVFSNISSSEQTHTSAIYTLLKKYNIADPVGSNALGVFADSNMQALYTSLVTEGNKSVLNAFKVGATIEDLDIYDLNNWNSKIDNQDIKFVYQNLNKGSRNHMRSFYSQVVSAGGTYSAQFISQSELEAIINTPKETGSW